MKPKKIKHEKIPHFVQIETSYNCNARCTFCYNPYRNIPINENKITEVVKAIARNHIPQIQLTGGEVATLPTKLLNKLIDILAEKSSVTIQTNAHKYIKGLTKNLTAIYVSLHGTKEYHDKLQKPERWKEIVKTIKKYIADGFEVNCDFTLTSVNFTNFEDIAMMASKWGVHQYSVNKFEPAGLGVKNFAKLMPTVEQFKSLLDQMIRVQKKTKMLVGFCTAIPYCLDLRMAEYGLLSNCGAGVSFLSVSPDGEVRICNQSSTSYGNVLKKDIVAIQNSKKIDEFRNKSWVTKPCSGCFLFDLCLGGCKVDNSVGQKYCVDYAVRGLKKCPISKSEFYKRVKKYERNKDDLYVRYPLKASDNFVIDRFTKLNEFGKGAILTTRYQSVKLDQESTELMKIILSSIDYKEMLVKANASDFEKKDLDRFIESLIHLNVIGRNIND